MSLSKLKEDIKTKNFKRCYLLYGNESYLIRYYKNSLSEAVLDGGNEMNRSVFTGKNPDISEIVGLSETLPFFSSYRLIIIENSGFFSSQNSMADFIEKIPDTAVILFTDYEVDKRSRLFKVVSKHGLCTEFNAENEKSLVPWLIGLFTKNGVKITESIAIYMISRVGTGMDTLSNEADKLTAYAYEKGFIEKKDIDEVCPETIADQIFKMMDSLGRKDRTAVLRYYYDLLERREAPLKILSLITRHFHILLHVKELSESGRTSEAASLLSVPAFAIKNYLPQVKNFSSELLKEALEYSASLDKDIKTGLINEKTAVEALLIRYSTQVTSNKTRA